MKCLLAVVEPWSNKTLEVLEIEPSLLKPFYEKYKTLELDFCPSAGKI